MSWCPDHSAPIHPTRGCYFCTLEWQDTDQRAGAALVRGSMPTRARARPLTAPAAPLPPRDPDRLERTRARIDQLEDAEP